MGLFIGQPAAFFSFLRELATAADAAQRETQQTFVVWSAWRSAAPQTKVSTIPSSDSRSAYGLRVYKGVPHRRPATREHEVNADLLEFSTETSRKAA